MTVEKPTKLFQAIIAGIAVCVVLILSMIFLGGCVFEHLREEVRRNIIHELTHGNSKTDGLSWLHETSPNEGKTYNAEKFQRNGHLYPKDIIGKRDLGHFEWGLNKREEFQRNGHLYPKDIGKRDLRHFGWGLNKRSLKKYRNPNRARAMNLKKHGNEGKHGFDDSYFLGPETSCQVPEGLETVDIRCKMWPTYKRCISYCVYGSTFDEGIQREHSCTYKENKWSKDFDECKPFVNCKVQLKSPGNVKCFDNELSTKPYCDIYCEIHEDKDEVKTQSYHCNANATWTPPLPFCAQPRDNVPLAKAPAVIEHTVFKYPEAYKKPVAN